MKRPRSPCFVAGEHRRRFEVRRLHNAAAAAPLLRRKRTVQDCGFYRTPGPSPEKRPRLEGVDDSHAFLWEVQATPKEPAFGKDSKHNKQHNKNGGNNGSAGGGAGGPAVTAALVQSPVTSPMEDAALPLMVEAAGGGKPDEELLSTAAAVEMAGPPLPADAAMMEIAGTPSDEDDPAFNAFNYWKTPFPDVNGDVIME